MQDRPAFDILGHNGTVSCCVSMNETFTEAEIRTEDIPQEVHARRGITLYLSDNGFHAYDLIGRRNQKEFISDHSCC